MRRNDGAQQSSNHVRKQAIKGKKRSRVQNINNFEDKHHPIDTNPRALKGVSIGPYPRALSRIPTRPGG